MMQIMIDIPEEFYKSIQDNDYCGISNADMYNAIKNGTPLPKGRGKLTEQQKKYDCCRDCKYLSNKKCSVGYLCEHPTKHFRTEISCWKPKAAKACKQFERGVYNG